MIKKILLVSILFGSTVFLTACSHTDETSTTTQEYSQDETQTNNKAQEEEEQVMTPQVLKVDASLLTETKLVKVELENGLKFTITVYPKIAPNTAKNFLDKFSSGFYNGKNFHRVEDWVVQGGDPSGNGTGGGSIPLELNDQPFKLGAVGVASRGDMETQNDSQFFVVTKDSTFLDAKYANFGQVTEGMDNVLKIEVGDKIKTATVE